MNTVVVDIETIGTELDEATKAELTKRCETEEEAAEELGRTALYALTGQVVCVGMLGLDTGRRSVLCSEDEAGLLSHFWSHVPRFDLIVTFNGRRFDLPFIIMRSAILHIEPTRKDLMGYRYTWKPHCDLADQLTFYGATRPFTLDMYCRAFGIKSPKENMTGKDVSMAFVNREFNRIAEYNSCDLDATAAIYDKWLKYFKPPSR